MQARPIGIAVLSIALGALGVATLLGFLVGLARGPAPDASWLLVVLALAYGATALSSARTLWRLSPTAPFAFLLWCASACTWTFALAASVPELRNAWAIPGLATGALCLVIGYRYIRRVCAPAV